MPTSHFSKPEAKFKDKEDLWLTFVAGFMFFPNLLLFLLRSLANKLPVKTILATLLSTMLLAIILLSKNIVLPLLCIAFFPIACTLGISMRITPIKNRIAQFQSISLEKKASEKLIIQKFLNPHLEKIVDLFKSTPEIQNIPSIAELENNIGELKKLLITINNANNRYEFNKIVKKSADLMDKIQITCLCKIYSQIRKAPYNAQIALYSHYLMHIKTIKNDVTTQRVQIIYQTHLDELICQHPEFQVYNANFCTNLKGPITPIYQTLNFLQFLQFLQRRYEDLITTSEKILATTHRNISSKKEVKQAYLNLQSTLFDLNKAIQEKNIESARHTLHQADLSIMQFLNQTDSSIFQDMVSPGENLSSSKI